MSDAVKQILDEVTRRGLILVHDQVLPSATGLIAGGPVSGSWWSHPQANTIYNALGAIEDRVATVKLVCKKNTLVSEALWPDLVAIGASNDRWQLDPLTPDAIDLLAEVNSCDEPIVIDKSSRSAAKQIEERLLVWATEIHTESGHHVKAYGSWSRWSRLRNVTSHESRNRLDHVSRPLSLTGHAPAAASFFHGQAPAIPALMRTPISMADPVPTAKEWRDQCRVEPPVTLLNSFQAI